MIGGGGDAAAAAAASSGRELSSPPTDGISNLRFSNHSDHLLVSSWDAVSHTLYFIFLLPGFCQF
jgi:hypothetical protein